MSPGLGITGSRLDAIATEYVLPVELEEARLRLARPPPDPAFNYMLPGGQHPGENVGRWNPHVMIQTPYRTNEEIGGMPGSPEYPFIGFDERGARCRSPSS